MTPEEIAETGSSRKRRDPGSSSCRDKCHGHRRSQEDPAQWLCSARNTTRRYVSYPWATSPKNSAVVHTLRTQAPSCCFKIVSEAGIAAGVRRIEALTGNGVIEYYKKQEAMLHEAAKALKAQPAEVAEKITHLQAEVKSLQSENESLKSKLAQGSLGDVMNQIVDVKGVKLLAAKVEGVDMNGLRDLGDQLKEKIGEGVVVLAAVNGGKVNLLAMATDAAQKAGAHAGNLIKGVAAIVGGGGGGRPNMAQAGGKNPEKADEAVKAAAGILEQQIH